MQTSDDTLIESLRQWRTAGKPAALATVVSTWGSSPRPEGSHLAVDGDGHFLGSVSGGCIEGAVIEAAMQSMQGGRPRLLEFGVSDEQAWQVGLACGGRVQVFVDAVGQGATPRDRIAAAMAAREALVVVTRLVDGAQCVVDAQGCGGDFSLCWGCSRRCVGAPAIRCQRTPGRQR
jgi:xanthine/CO dehydrogenase XdhC/CoxF family maturation factor